MICEQVSDYLRKANANTPSPRVSTPKIESTIENSSVVMTWAHFFRRVRSIEIGFPISPSESIGTTEPRYANGSCRTKSTIPRMVETSDPGQFCKGMLRNWGAHERVSVKRARAEEGKQ